MHDGFTIIIKDKRKKESPFTPEIAAGLDLKMGTDYTGALVTGRRELS